MDVANNLFGEKAIRKHLFGKFSTNDIVIKVSFLTKLPTQTAALWTVLVSNWDEFCMPHDLFVNVCILTGLGGGALTRPVLLGPLSYFSVATGLLIMLPVPRCYCPRLLISSRNGKESPWTTVFFYEFLLTLVALMLLQLWGEDSLEVKFFYYIKLII